MHFNTFVISTVKVGNNLCFCWPVCVITLWDLLEPWQVDSLSAPKRGTYFCCVGKNSGNICWRRFDLGSLSSLFTSSSKTLFCSLSSSTSLWWNSFSWRKLHTATIGKFCPMSKVIYCGNASQCTEFMLIKLKINELNMSVKIMWPQEDTLVIINLLIMHLP